MTAVWWALGVNSVISIAYFAISLTLVLRVLLPDQQWRRNPLAVATAGIFFTCGAGHGGHALHAFEELRGGPPSGADWHLISVDLLSAFVAVWYWTLRGRFASLGGAGRLRSLFDDVRDVRSRHGAAALDALWDSLLVLRVRRGADGRPVDFEIAYANDATLTSNDTLLDVLTATAEEVRGQPASVLLDTPAGRELLAQLLRVAAAPQDGRVVALDGAALAPLLHGRTLDVQAVAHGEDITVVWRDRTAAVQARAELAVRDAELRATFDAAPVGVALVDSEGVLRQVNPALTILAGSTALLGRPLPELFHPHDAEDLAVDIRHAVTAPGAKPSREARLRQVGGVDTWVHCSLAAVPPTAPGQPPDVVVHVQDIGERKRFERQLMHLADHDPLTGLFNRRRFERELERHCRDVARYGPFGALLMIDLDRFKEVNDSLGHPAGDQLIVSMSEVLQQHTRETDVISRLGGDEFAVLVTQGDVHEAKAVAKRLVQAVRTCTTLLDGVRPGSVTASIGIAVVQEDATPPFLMAAADMAMYDAKDAGRDGYAVAEEGTEGRSRTQSRLQWVERIRDALDGDGFELHLQPIVDLRTGHAVSYEALLRLRGDDGELVLPSHFLYIAEQHEIIAQVDAWVLRRSLELIAEARDAGGVLNLNVNISGRSMSDSTLIDQLEEGLRRLDLPGSCLTLEITETAAVSNVVAARQLCERLRALGCALALDDFGAGFGSFYYVKHLPFDHVKIDGEFVGNCLRSKVDRVIVDAVVGMAGGLGRAVVAEHVEDVETAEYLLSRGVVFAQGFHLGRPVPATQVERGALAVPIPRAPSLTEGSRTLAL